MVQIGEDLSGVGVVVVGICVWWGLSWLEENVECGDCGLILLVVLVIFISGGFC